MISRRKLLKLLGITTIMVPGLWLGDERLSLLEAYKQVLRNWPDNGFMPHFSLMAKDGSVYVGKTAQFKEADSEYLTPVGTNKWQFVYQEVA